MTARRLVLSVALCHCRAVVGRSASHASSASNSLALEPGGRPPRDQLFCEPGRNDGRLQPALPCKNGPFLMDYLAHYGEGIGGSMLARQQQLIYAEAIGARYIDDGSKYESNRPEGPGCSHTVPLPGCAGWILDAPAARELSSNDLLCYAARYPDLAAAYGKDTEALLRHWSAHGRSEGRNAYCTPTQQKESSLEGGSSALGNASQSLRKRVWDAHDHVDYTAFFGMGPDADCDFCSLQHWTSANSSHLRVVNYGEMDIGQMMRQQEDICTARELGQPLPTTDPVLRQFTNNPKRQNMVLKFEALKLFVHLKRELADWTLPCMFSEAFVARFAKAREARRLVPSRPADEIWMAIHLRWGDVGSSGTMQARYADKTVPLTLLTEQTLKVKQLLGVSRRLVVHFFSEIDEAAVEDFTSALPGTRLHTSASVAETFDLWSQCEISLGTRGSQFFMVASHLAPRSLILDRTSGKENSLSGVYASGSHGGTRILRKRHPIVYVGPDGFSEAAWHQAAQLLWGAVAATPATPATNQAAPEPDAEPCADWCSAHEALWSDKCTWDNCLGCLTCTDALQPVVAAGHRA